MFKAGFDGDNASAAFPSVSASLSMWPWPRSSSTFVAYRASFAGDDAFLAVFPFFVGRPKLLDGPEGQLFSDQRIWTQTLH